MSVTATFLTDTDKVVRYDKQALTDEQQAQARENIGANAKRTITDYEYPLEITDARLWNVSGLTNSNPYFHYATVDVIAGYRIDITGWQSDPDLGYRAYYFYDADGVCIEAPSVTKGTAVNAKSVLVPDGAVRLVVNGYPDKSPVRVVGEYPHEVTMQEIMNVVAQQGGELDNCLKKSVATMKNYVYPLEITEGYIRNNRPYDIPNPYFQYATVKVTPGDVIDIIGWQSDSANYCAYYFYDAAGACVGSYTGETGTLVVARNVIVPDGAVTLVVNGQPAKAPIYVIGDRTAEYGLDFVLDEINSGNVAPKLITLGDSITQQGIEDDGWVRYFIEKTGCRLIANVAVKGATLHDKEGSVYDGNPVLSGADNNVNNVLGNQVQKIINNNYEAPDIIMIAIGTNEGIDITQNNMFTTYYNTDGTLIPLENVDRTTDAGAYRYALETLHNLYPDALIFWCSPILAAYTMRQTANILKYAESLRIATDYTGQVMIDTHHCGINGANEIRGENGECLVDGLHPNINGAKRMGYYNASKVKPFLGNNFVKV